ncbi:MAG: hypothetical protein PHG85_03290 [Candidatus Altiarchaeota archaeon]|nr:hypothetical protein [Candidatus Altiarchaeota archaeon]
MEKDDSTKRANGLWIALLCVISMTATASSQSYVTSDGTTLAAITPSNLIVDYDLSTYSPNVEPGETGTINLVIRNTGTQKAESVVATFIDTLSIRTSKQFYIGTIQPLASTTISLTYNIEKNASIGLLILPVKLDYDGYDADGEKVDNLHSNYDFPLQVYGNPKLTLQNPEIGQAGIGKNLEIKLVIRNQKSRAYNVIAKMDDAANQQNTGNAITILGSNKQYIGDIDEGKDANIVYNAYVDEEAETGAYTLPLTIYYENKGHENKTESFNIGVYVTGEPDITITNTDTDPDEIHRNTENVELKATVANTGEGEVTNLKVTLMPKEPFTNAKSYTQEKSLGILKTKATSIVSFYLNVDENAKPGLYETSFLLEYQTGMQDVNKTISINLEVKDSPDFRLSYDKIEANAGEGGEMRLSAENKGEDCDSVTLWVMKKSEQPFDFTDKSQYIGDLKTGQQGEAVIDFTVDEKAQKKSYILPLEVRCTIDDTVYVESETVLVTVNGKKESSTNTYLIALAAAAAAVYIVYLSIKKNKK